MDKSGANYVGIENVNMLLMLVGLINLIEICQVKQLNNAIEQDHRFIKKITIPIRNSRPFIQHERLSKVLKCTYDSKKAAVRKQYSGLQTVYGLSRIIVSAD
jgi:transposase-like protein